MCAKFSVWFAAIPGMCAKIGSIIAAIPGVCAKRSICITSLAVSINNLPLPRPKVHNPDNNLSIRNLPNPFPTLGTPCLGKSVNSPWFARQIHRKVKSSC